jgi:hypothetical protein
MALWGVLLAVRIHGRAGALLAVCRNLQGVSGQIPGASSKGGWRYDAK